MEGAFAKLTVLLVLVASASCFAPFSAEAKHKQCGGGSSPSPFQPPTQPPTVAPTPLPQSPTEAPTPTEAASPPPPPPPPSNIGVPGGYVSPPPGYVAPPYQIHGCGYPCSDSNDCDWPCTVCCYQNNTCCWDLPYPEN